MKKIWAFPLFMILLLAGFGIIHGGNPLSFEYLNDPFISFVLSEIFLTMGFVLAVLCLFITSDHTYKILSLINFALYVFITTVYGYGDVISVMFVLTGAVFILIEIIIPGFGIAGVIGGVSLFIGVFRESNDMLVALIVVMIAFVISFITAYIVITYGISENDIYKFALQTKLTKEKGYVSSENNEKFLGKTGIAKTILRPSGIAIIDDEKVSVVAQGEFIEKNTEIEVFKIEGNNIFVRRV